MKKTWQRLGSLLVVLAMLLACVPGVLAADDVTYTVAGDADLCGAAWNPAANAMTETSEGIWQITFTNVPAGTYEFKVTDGSWDNCWGVSGSDRNYSVTLETARDVTITFNAATKEITTDADPAGGETTDVTYTVAGEAGLCGAAWDPSQNAMTETSTGIWEITFTNIAAGTYKFKVTDGTWNNSWGTNGGDYNVGVAVLSNVTITFNAETKEITTSLEPLTDEEPTAYTVKAHFLPEEGWGSPINAWVWMNEGDSIPGFEDYHMSWPGKAISANAEHELWYDLTITTYNADGFKLIFNDGSNQTLNLFTGTLTGDVELWFIGNQRYAYAPEEWSGAAVYTYSIYFHKQDHWATVSAYAWVDSDQILGDWPGTVATPAKGNDGWYHVSFATGYPEVNAIFNNNGAGNQTGDLSVAIPEGERSVEAWIEDFNVSYTAPEGWNAVRPGNTVKIHFMPPYTSWGNRIYAWIWNGGGDLPGYEEYHKYWPGKQVEEDHENPGWYYLEVTTELSDFNFIFSGKLQTKDLYLNNITGDMEIWVYGNDIYDYKPDVLPATGDNFNLVLYGGLMVVSLIAIGVVVLVIKKKSK
ncbi:MAG: starch-binding protein [Faecousia sp.]